MDNQANINLEIDNDIVSIKLVGNEESLIELISSALENDVKFKNLLFLSIVKWKLREQGDDFSKICLN